MVEDRFKYCDMASDGARFEPVLRPGINEMLDFGLLNGVDLACAEGWQKVKFKDAEIPVQRPLAFQGVVTNPVLNKVAKCGRRASKVDPGAVAHQVNLLVFEGAGFPFRPKRLGELGSIGASQFDLIRHTVLSGDLVNAHIGATVQGWSRALFVPLLREPIAILSRLVPLLDEQGVDPNSCYLGRHLAC